MGLPSGDILLATAVRLLLHYEKPTAAKALSLCTAELTELWGGESAKLMASILLRAPLQEFDSFQQIKGYWKNCDFYDQLNNPDELDEHFPWGDPRNSSMDTLAETLIYIHKAIRDVLPQWSIEFEHSVQLMEVSGDWKQDLARSISGEKASNQAGFGENLLVWEHLKFRSKSEIKIAEELDKRKVLFLPNCMSRLGHSKRENREADFLICHQGKWGILEVDGEPYHPPSRTTEDHERDRLFKAHGITLAEHFDANECYSNPEKVVDQFLYLLKTK